MNHRDGMVAMIRMRGGIDQPDLDCLLRFRAYWIDMLSAYYAQTTPSFPVNGLSALISHQSPSVSLAETGFCWLLEISNPSSLIIRGLHELVSFITEVRMLSGARLSAEVLYSFTGRRTWIEWALSSLESNPSLDSDESIHSGIKICCRLAARIYINIVLRKMDQGHALLSHLACRLKGTLCQTDMGSRWEGKSELLTWTLFQGGAAAVEPGTRKWYVSHLVSCSQVLGLQIWNNVFQLLEKFLWASPEIERHFKPLWYEIVLSLSHFETSE
ncbi:hypothetical protein N431DRAFT_210257 [Stipitochalara longipes BDJ]|nr:hypothetical protein N431DRAFT_210257 [Stipitochalara longipes BDJ]